jgi:hypothetical protein
MPLSPHFNDPDHWRQRAEECRALAEQMSDEWFGRARATGRVGGGAFHSAAGVGNLIALIKKLSGVSVSLEDRMRLPQR